MVAEDTLGKTWYFDVCGSFSSSRPGHERTDTNWKALGRSAVLALNGYHPVLLLTTHLPRPGKGGDTALRSTKHKLFYDLLWMFDLEARDRLRQYCLRGPGCDPLPGWWAPDDIYGPADNVPVGAGLVLARRLPLARVGEPSISANAPKWVKRLPHRVVLYIPSQTRQGNGINPATREETIRAIKRLLIDRYEGCTSYDGRGAWAHPVLGTADEAVMTVETYCETPCDPTILQEVVHMILVDLDQNAVSAVIDNEMFVWSREAV